MELVFDDGQTILIVAAQEGHLAVVQALLPLVMVVNARVIDPSPVDPECSEKTALGIVFARGHTAVAEMLRSAGAHG